MFVLSPFVAIITNAIMHRAKLDNSCTTSNTCTHTQTQAKNTYMYATHTSTFFSPVYEETHCLITTAVWKNFALKYLCVKCFC